MIVSDDPIPSNLLSSHKPVLVSKCLLCFVMETRNTNVEPHPPATLWSLQSEINHILKTNKVPITIFSEDAYYGFTTQLAIYILTEMEFNREVLKSLHMMMIIYCRLKDHLAVDYYKYSSMLYIGLYFCLISVNEQYEISPCQLVWCPPDTTVYIKEAAILSTWQVYFEKQTIEI